MRPANHSAHHSAGRWAGVALLARTAADRIRECGIDRNYRKGPKPSDHTPLLLELA